MTPPPILVRTEPERIQISSLQFRANPLLLDRHPMRCSELGEPPERMRLAVDHGLVWNIKQPSDLAWKEMSVITT